MQKLEARTVAHDDLACGQDELGRNKSYELLLLQTIAQLRSDKYFVHILRVLDPRFLVGNHLLLKREHARTLSTREA